jgi:hypothetical protein
MRAGTNSYACAIPGSAYFGAERAPNGGSDVAPADLVPGEFLDRTFFRSLVDDL